MIALAGLLHNPLSLEQSCFLKVVSDFETFPPESLALLPLSLRHKLARNLPAVDVCQLEQTSFAKGMNMDEVWTHLAEMTNMHASDKNGYFSSVCTILLNHSDQLYPTVTRKLLFSIKDCLGIDDWGAFEHHLQVHDSVVVPYRHQESYRQFASGSHSDAQLVRFILQNTHCLPKSLTIHCKEFARCIRSESWANENWKVLVEYLSGVREFSLYFREAATTSDESATTSVVPGFIFNAMSARGRRQLQLEGLYLRGHNDLLEETLISVGYYLRRDSGLQCGSCDSLRRLQVEVISSGPVCDPTARELSDIIENQPSISSVWLDFISPTATATSSGHRRLCSTLSRVLQLTQFTDMCLEGVTPLPADFQQLLYLFLTTPCHHTQTLSISTSLSQDMSGFVDDLSCCHPDDSNLSYKRLGLHSVVFPAAITQWLSNHVYLRLDTLDLTNIDCAGTGMLPFVLSHPRLEVKNLTVSLGDSLDTPEGFQWQSGCFNGILGSSLLYELHLHCFGVLVRENTTLLLEFITGIFKQVGVGMLETLDLQYNDLGLLPDAQLILLFEAILSLPKLDRFSLNLSENSLDDRQLKLLYRLWQEKCGGRKLMELICWDTVLDLNVLDSVIDASFYQDIAVYVRLGI